MPRLNRWCSKRRSTPRPTSKPLCSPRSKKRAVPELGHAQTLPQTQRLHLPPCPPGAAQSARARCTSAAVQRALAKLHRLEAAGCAVTCCMATCCMATRAAFRCCLVFPICVPYLWQPKGLVAAQRPDAVLAGPPPPKAAQHFRLLELGFWKSDNQLWHFPIRVWHFPIRGRLNARSTLSSV